MRRIVAEWATDVWVAAAAAAVVTACSSAAFVEAVVLLPAGGCPAAVSFCFLSGRVAVGAAIV